MKFKSKRRRNRKALKFQDENNSEDDNGYEPFSAAPAHESSPGKGTGARYNSAVNEPNEDEIDIGNNASASRAANAMKP